MKTLKLCQFASLTLLMLSGWSSTWAQITPSADAYTNSADPTTNYGGATTLDVDGAAETSYIQFNLASIPRRRRDRSGDPETLRERNQLG
jgi:hypothetical protein